MRPDIAVGISLKSLSNHYLVYLITSDIRFFFFFCCFWFSVVHITLEKGLIIITLILKMYLASQYSKATETVQGTANNNEPHAQETRTKMGNKPE